jgi:hypothetical protein
VVNDSVYRQKSYVKYLYEGIVVEATRTSTFDANRTLYENVIIGAELTRNAAVNRTFYEGVVVNDSVYRQKSYVKYLYEGIVVEATRTSTFDANRTLYENVTVAAEMVRNAAVNRTYSEGVVIADHCIRQFLPGGAEESKYLFEGVVVGAEYTRGVGRNLYEGINVSAQRTVEASYSRVLAEGVVFAEVSTRSASYNRTFFENVIVAEAVTRVRGASKTLFEGVVLAAGEVARSAGYSRYLFEDVVISATIDRGFAGQYSKYLFEGIIVYENDVWGPYREEIVWRENPPGGRRRPIYIPPVFPPGYIVLFVLVGMLVHQYFYGVPYIRDSQADAYARRERIKWRLKKIFVLPVERRKRKIESRYYRAKYKAEAARYKAKPRIPPLFKGWRDRWRKLWKSDRGR